MEESSNVVHQRQRKRSNDNNAFAKFVQFSPTLEDESYDKVDNFHKRLKPNSESLFSETTTNLSTSFPFPKQNIHINEALHFSSPSSSLKLSGNCGPSPQSIATNSSHFDYVTNDGKLGKTISTSHCQWKEDESEMESVVYMAAEVLSKRPKTGGIYTTIAAHRDCVVKRLKDLANNDPTIDVGLEMADAAHLLKLMSFSTNEIEMAGQKGHKGAMLLIQAEILHNKGQELIAECQNLIKDTL
ncbi:hypothetical protein Lal_00038391 [Lupinus albus]|uniref:Uncharacterized protein n=1 Tax=Lupinus albus TaxID=3870 RepID=A0A6A4NRC3_LUPAL|nr:hypothetical protein Lalb_Chr19g0124731 [Lupinus albus]KAF1883897.1 hypothetical protein Lal_00038391 [Lupinus albus]